MTARALAAATLAVALLAAPAAAQESVFNLGAFGLPGTGESVRARAMGGAGLGLSGESFSLENPASMARFRRAGFYLSLVGQRTSVEDETASGEFEDVWFPMGQVVVPALGGWTLGGGYLQAVDFDGALDATVDVDGVPAPATLDVDGALSAISPAAAYRMDARTTFGVALDVYLGSRTTVRSVALGEEGERVAADTLARDFRAVGFTVGAERLLGERAWLSAAWRYRPSITSEITAAPGEGLVGRTSDIAFPSEFVAGASVLLAASLTAATEVRWAGWGDVEIEGVEGSRTVDALDLGAGLEWTPASRTALLFGPSAPLRAGARWRRLPLAVGGARVTEWAATVGYGIGFTDKSRVDVSLESGRRGAIDENGLAETFLRLGVGLAVYEPWQRVD